MTLSAIEIELFQKSVLELEKLNVEVARLRSDVNTLWRRIEPFEDESPKVFPSYDIGRPRNLSEVVKEFTRLRKDVVECQSIILWIKALLDQIQNDSWSRADMKPWIKDR